MTRDAAPRPRRLPALPGWRRWAALFRRTAAEISADQVSVVASGVALRVALAAFPAIALLVWMAQHVAGAAEASAVAHTLSGLLPDVSRSVIDDAVGGALRHNPVDGRAEAPWLGGSAPLAGAVFSLWSANSGTKALFAALNIVYDKEEGRPFLRRTAVTLLFTVFTIGLVALVGVVMAASPIALTRLGLATWVVAGARWLRWPGLVLGLAPALALLYRYAPNRGRERWPLVTVGSGLAALLLVLNAALFSTGARHMLSLGPTYGPLSAVAAFLLWLWIAMLIVLCCAELDSEIERGTSLYGGHAGPDRT